MGFFAMLHGWHASWIHVGQEPTAVRPEIQPNTKETTMHTMTFARNAALAHNLFDEFFADVERSVRTAAFKPTVDVAEIDGAYVLRVDLPGVAREDVKIETKDDALTISGHRKAPEVTKGYRYTESGYGDFSRSFSLPKTVDREAIAARFENGVLEVKLSLKPEVGPRKIEIG